MSEQPKKPPAWTSRDRARKAREFAGVAEQRLAADRAELAAMRKAGATPLELRQQENLVNEEQSLMVYFGSRAERLEANARGGV
ncbi:MAG TPA: hypothetical protein VG734_25485 [Lacunisphaera sp.]|nr:hypothetical protein [Lacunisphaera sp.]